MEEHTGREFRAEILYDLASYKELTKANLLYSSRANASMIFSIAIILLFSFLYGFVLKQTSFLSFLLLLYLGIYWGMQLLHSLRSRDGDLTFKRMLGANNGKPPHNEVTFTEENIRVHNLDTNGCNSTTYSQLRAVYETEHFLVFLQEHRLYSAIRKDTVTGGTVDALLEFVFQKSPFLKKQKLSSLLPGKIVKVTFIVVSVLCLLAAVWLSSPVQTFVHKQQSINNFMSYHQIADQLEDLGITGIDDALIAEMEAYDEEYDYVYSYDVGNKALDLLCWVGMGEYDYDTWEWTPSDSGVYWFDLEVFSLETMYTDFLTGVRALAPESLNFTAIAEDLSDVDWESGTGTQRVSFTWNDTSYTLDANVDYDWFDLEAAATLADIVEKGNTGSKLYFASDSGQGILVFYGSPDWEKAFEKATGIALFEDPHSVYAFP